ncbi:hypothetical protein [Tautonia sociabilis]|nr:hypothetical protein [Tautonia sociabilis]
MVSQTELHRWRKYRSQSRAMLRPAALFGILGTLVVLALLYVAEDPTAG